MQDGGRMSVINGAPVISAESLSKIYRMGPVELEVFRNLSFDIPPGQIVSVIGPSGVGKSTLLNIIGTLDVPTEGRLSIEGQDVSGLTDRELSVLRNQKIGFVFQFHHLLPEFDALENVAIPGWIAGRDRAETADRSAELLREVGLEKRIHHKPSEMSGGEQQRVAVARALVNTPAILLADEPTGNLDRQNSEALQDLLWSLCREKRQTMMLVTHNEKMADGADRVIELYERGILRDHVRGQNSGEK